MKILDGKLISDKISLRVSRYVKQKISEGNRVPRIDILLVGDDFASSKYVQMKEKKCFELGIKCIVHRIDGKESEKSIVALINKLNKERLTDGIMIQLPLPKDLNSNNILESIDSNKDVDGLTSSNFGKIFRGDPDGIPCATAKGIITLLDEYKIGIEGKNVVVVGRSNIVGLPTSALFLSRNATVTVCHTFTKNLKSITSNADILVIAIGKAEYIDKKYIKKGAVVIDVGINRNLEGKLVGDIKYNSVKNIPSYISPVPGGVGPMTIISLIENLITCYTKNIER